MNGTRLWTLGSIVVIVALLAGTWLIGISPRLTEATLANESRETVEVQNSAHQVTLASLQAQFEDITQLRKDRDEMRVAVPADAGTPELISQINALASSSGITVATLTVSDPSAYAPIENTTEDPELAAVLAGVPAGAFFVVPLDLAVSGKYEDVMSFVAGLQAGKRLFLLHDLSLTSGVMQAGSDVELSMSGQVFVLTNASAELPTDPSATSGDAAAEGAGELPQ